jgi:hypothetical protein
VASELRRVLIRDQADRDAIASRLIRYRDQNGQDWADIIDFLTMYLDLVVALGLQVSEALVGLL